MCFPLSICLNEFSLSSHAIRSSQSICDLIFSLEEQIEALRNGDQWTGSTKRKCRSSSQPSTKKDNQWWGCKRSKWNNAPVLHRRLPRSKDLSKCGSYDEHRFHCIRCSSPCRW